MPGVRHRRRRAAGIDRPPLGRRPMKRLVTQFDDTRTRATVATPTCCCCCCCFASIISSTAVTVLNVNELAGQTALPEPRWLYNGAALLVLPVAVLLAIGAGLLFAIVDKPDAPWVGVAAFLLAWPALLVALYRQLGLRRSGKPVAITVICGLAVFFAEVGVVAAFLSDDDYFADDGGGLFLAFLLFEVALGVGLVPLLRRWMAT